MNKRSTMFINDLTNIDFAYICPRGTVVGGSYRPKFLISGQVDPQEQVVVDFSTIKKTVKKIIDDPNNGWDHKLWFFEDKSAGTCIFNDEFDTVTVKTDRVTISGPSNIVKYIPADSWLGTELQDELVKLYPDIDIQVEVDMTTDLDLHPLMNTKAHLFRYTHGLKNSTSWGCQNIAHGHLSYIAAETANPLATDLFLASIANQLDGAMFVWKDNLIGVDANRLEVGYDCSRGRMECSVSYDQAIVIETETTIEHLVDFIADTYTDVLKDLGVKKLFVSEGLSKGAVAEID